MANPGAAAATRPDRVGRSQRKKPCAGLTATHIDLGHKLAA